MEYVNERGSFHDIPVEEIVKAWQALYGAERVSRWSSFTKVRPAGPCAISEPKKRWSEMP
ncbi:MAG: hypothetical protein MZV70_12085 [Desulfobacterales bacterium]|nr:hypothetical protein [Desulfobacterales bacterium]